MSGGPPHHPHNRQVPATNIPNSAWNHLQVPNFFPRQPQLAHMPTEHSILHQPTWHTPTTTAAVAAAAAEALKLLPPHPPPPVFESLFPRDCVDLSVARNGAAPPTAAAAAAPISLSVRDTNKINSLPPSALEVHAVELTKPRPMVATSAAPEQAKAQKRSNVRVDSILERLNPAAAERSEAATVAPPPPPPVVVDPPPAVSVIVQPTGGFDDNSNSSGAAASAAAPTSTNARDDDAASSDSVDSNKSRRKRKPSKTVRVSKEEERQVAARVAVEADKDPVRIVGQMLEEAKHPEKVESSSELDELIAAKVRRKTLSESETIDDIAAMVQEGLKEKQQRQLQQASQQQQQQEEEQQQQEQVKTEEPPKPISVSVIKTKEHLCDEPPAEEASKKATNPHFVEVENKLEEMFAGIEEPVKADPLDLDDAPASSVVTSSTEIKKKTASPRRPKRRPPRRGSEATDATPTKKKKGGKGKKAAADVYAYDSGSNASSTKSKGPFVQIRGPRESPLSVSVVNTPSGEEAAAEAGSRRPRRYHDDGEYRRRARPQGLHCSTLSAKYDARTRDASWVCSFCRRGPHATDGGGTGGGAAGDLFGPYLITTRCAEFERRLDDPFDRNFRSKKVRRAIDQDPPRAKKPKRRPSDASDAAPDAAPPGVAAAGGGAFEVWAHEECVVWSPGVHLVGPRIVGLEEAVWTSSEVACRRCGLGGANVACAGRGCVDVMHVACCRSSGWRLDDDDFRALCAQHRLS